MKLISTLFLIYSIGFLFSYYVWNPVTLIIYAISDNIVAILYLITFAIYVSMCLYRKAPQNKVVLGFTVFSLLIFSAVKFVIPKTILRKTELPYAFSNIKSEMMPGFIGSPQVYEYANKKLVLAFQDSKMAFGSGHHILGCYQNGKIKDELIYGAYPITLRIDELIQEIEIRFSIPINGVDSIDNYNRAYINGWKEGKNKICGETITYRVFEIKSGNPY